MFLGVGTKHQNVIAECCIQTICYWVRTLMVHSALHWERDNAANICLWPFPIQHAVWLYNQIPNRLICLSPLKILTKTKSDHYNFLWVFVLDPQIQDGKKIPKWNHRSCMGQFEGISLEHSSFVANMRHLQTSYVSLQYHLIFEDLYHTVASDNMPSKVTDSIVTSLFESSHNTFVKIERD